MRNLHLEQITQAAVASFARLPDARQRQLVQDNATSQASVDNAQSNLQQAQANLRLAQLNLEYTEVRAPFAGRVRDKHVDMGQFVARGTPVARVYAVDYAEVRLPIPDADTAYVDLPIAYRGDERRVARLDTEPAAFIDLGHLFEQRFVVRTVPRLVESKRLVKCLLFEEW